MRNAELTRRSFLTLSAAAATTSGSVLYQWQSGGAVVGDSATLTTSIPGNYTLLVSCPSINITTANLPGGTIGTAYNQTVGVTPAGSYSFAVTSGALPPGLTLNAVSGVISGTPATTGTFSFTLSAAQGACTGSQSFKTCVEPTDLAHDGIHDIIRS